MRIELRTSPGCPNAEPTRQLLAACLAEAGINEPIIELVGTYPSPTVLINGVDVMRAHDEAEGDVCRLDPPTHFRVLEALRTGQSATWIIPMAIAHAAAVLQIYQAGIETGDATFQTTAPSWEVFDADHLDQHRFVAVGHADRVIGWVAAVPVSSRCVYGGVIEHSVYVDATFQGSGVGTQLLTALIDSAESAGVWTIQCGIFPENAGSIALHQRCGFRVVGVRERIGQRGGRWRDVQLVERRSRIVGT